MRTMEEIEAEHQRLIRQDKEEIERDAARFNEKVEMMRRDIECKWDVFAQEKINSLGK